MSPHPPPVRRTALDRAWRTCGALAVDALAWSLGPAWLAEENPALVGARQKALADLARMRCEPRPLARPVIILNGYHAWAGVVESIRARVAEVTSGERHGFLAISFMDQACFEAQRDRVLREVGAWAGPDAEVDVIGISMGGLVGRHSAMRGHADGRVLRVKRFITLSSPHKGAMLAKIVAPDRTARSMRPGSDFLRQIDGAPSSIERYLPFTQLRDPVVGARNTAPDGHHPLWCSGSLVLSHFSVSHNPLVLATIARELRGEPPLFDWPAGPPPRN